MYDVSFEIRVQGQDSQYPTDVLEALMMTLKETAHDCNLDCFEHVSSLVHGHVFSILLFMFKGVIENTFSNF